MQQNQGRDREKIELFISARQLKNKDNFSESDPKCKIFYKDQSMNHEQLLGQTEVLKNNLNPNWKTTFQIDYIFEINQQIRLEVWDSDDSVGMDKDDLIGSVSTTVGNIMGSRNQIGNLELKHPKHGNQIQGKLLIKADKVVIDNFQIFMQWKGIKLLNTDGWFGKSDPFLRFFRKKEDTWLQVHESEFVKDNLDPLWKPFELPVARLNNGDHSLPFKVECWDNSKTGKHHYIGEFITSINEIKHEEKKLFQLKNTKEKNPGQISLVQYSIHQIPTFIDYLQGGEQINMMIAVDFTGSNGNPSHPTSLHYNTPNQMNQYQTALYQVSDVLLYYDFDKQVPMYGFGGVPNFPNYKSNNTEHCFPLTGTFEHPEVNGLQGIMDFYKGALQYVELSGPTYFGPILQYAKNIAEANSNKDIYSVLLILTDGEIHDMDKTIDIIQQCSKLPISVIIIGVGKEKFEMMRKLDGDEGPLKRNGQTAVRDLVQFVAFEDFKSNQQRLAGEVLAELPSQLVKYKQLLGKPPKPHQNINLSQVQ